MAKKNIDRTDEADDSRVSRVRNTERQDPLLHLALAMGDQMSGRRSGSFIEEQEKAGQIEVANQRQQLPTDGSEDSAWEKMGVVFGSKVKDDAIWRNVKLPKGWKIVATDHNMWTSLVDEKGRKRASIFYKAAFYDRSAQIRPERRFGTDVQRDDGGDHRRYDSSPSRGVAYDGDRKNVIFNTEWLAPLANPSDRSEASARYDKEQKLREVAEAFLKAKYPDYMNPAAYWDLP